MDKKQLIETFYKLLDGYKTSVDKMKNISGGKCGYQHSSPIGIRTKVVWIMGYLKKSGLDMLQLERDFKSIDDVFTEYKARNSAEYFQNVYCDFRSLVEHYDPSSILIDGYEFENEVLRRTDIEILYRELDGRYDVEALMKKVIGLDEILRKTIPEAIKSKTYAPEDRAYIPEDYWWRHLEKIYGKYDFIPVS